MADNYPHNDTWNNQPDYPCDAIDRYQGHYAHSQHPPYQTTHQRYGEPPGNYCQAPPPLPQDDQYRNRIRDGWEAESVLRNPRNSVYDQTDHRGNDRQQYHTEHYPLPRGGSNDHSAYAVSVETVASIPQHPSAHVGRFSDPYYQQRDGWNSTPAAGPRHGDARHGGYHSQQQSSYRSSSWDQQPWREDGGMTSHPRSAEMRDQGPRSDFHGNLARSDPLAVKVNLPRPLQGLSYSTPEREQGRQSQGYLQSAQVVDADRPVHRNEAGRMISSGAVTELHGEFRSDGCWATSTGMPGPPSHLRACNNPSSGHHPVQATSLPPVFSSDPVGIGQVDATGANPNYGGYSLSFAPFTRPINAPDLHILRSMILPGASSSLVLSRPRVASHSRSMPVESRLDSQSGHQETPSSRKRDRGGHPESARLPIQIVEKSFQRLEDTKGFQLLIKPTESLGPQMLEKQIHLLTGMQSHLLFDFVDYVCQLNNSSAPQRPSATAKPETDEGESSDAAEATRTVPPNLEPVIANGHRFLQRFVHFLPYPAWIAETCAHLENPSSTSAPPKIHIPTLEELNRILTGRNTPRLPAHAESLRLEPSHGAVSDVRSGAVPCRKFERIFIGNIKKELPLSVLQWLLDAFTLTASAGSDEERTEEEGKPEVEFTLTTGLTYPTTNYIYDAAIHRYANNGAFKGCVHVTLATNEDPDAILHLFHKRFLFDHSGVWVATTPHEAALLQAYCSALNQAWEASDANVRTRLGAVPRSPMTWELAGAERQSLRRMEANAEFVQSLISSRIRAPPSDRR